MTRGHHSPETRAAAVADYYASGDTAKTVAARHGIPRATFSAWVSQADVEQELAYVGGWETRGGIKYPLLPERRWSE